jgi:hypothetical protein
MLAMSTSPPSAGTSSDAPAATASSTAAAAGAVLFCGFRAPLWSRGLALQLRQDLLNSGGWTTTSGWLPHCVPHAFVALFDGLRQRHLLHARQTTHQQGCLCDGYSTTLVKASYLLRHGL